MDHLPEKLLLSIFALIEDGHTLLDLSLVCKRWRQVSRDPRAWAGVRLEVPCSRHEEISRQHAQVLIRAPALRSLALTSSLPGLGAHGYGVPPVRLGSALAQCTVPLSELHLGVVGAPSPSLPWLPNPLGAPLCTTLSMVQLLQRNRATLRTVSVSLRCARNVQQEVLQALASMPGIRDLCLEVSAFLAYNGELAGDALPGLRRLRFEVVLPLIGPATDADLLLQDVLRGAARSLREVRLSPYFGLREATIEALYDCVGLGLLAVNVRGVQAVTGMPVLEELVVEVGSMDEAAVEDAVTALFDPPLGELRRLRVVVDRLHVQPGVGRLLAALMRAAPGLTSLDVQCAVDSAMVMEADVAAELSGLLHLEEARFMDGGGALVPVLEGLPALRRVEGHFWVAGGDFKQCCDIVSSWRERRPPMKVSVRLNPLPLKPHTFRW